MSASDRGGLKAAFTNFKKVPDEAAEQALLGRPVAPEPGAGAAEKPSSYQIATRPSAELSGGLQPRPLIQREPVRQISLRCPLSLAGELRRKASFNQLEQQEIVIEGLKRVLAELPAPPAGWEG